MDICISKESEFPLRQQLAEQIVFHIATGKLQPGQALPSVRELARRLKIHHNTVSEAYQDLIRRMWLGGRRGSRGAVPSRRAALTTSSTLCFGWRGSRAIRSNHCANECASSCWPNPPITFW